uniref:syntaxin-2 isoform X2 n=1 Tax=Ciona intestinalis TaxID=7719 RepID=UPI000180C91D|nr:syntaxin-2 isoform X2 [Ciona intestinalis]|eukprot:XP_026696488.1 syntaxin-2 isoform X2 [Ciona intestinalis]
MLRDRLPDLLRLAESDPTLYKEPEYHEELPIDPSLIVLFQRAEKVTKFIKDMEAIVQEMVRQHEDITWNILNEKQYREQTTRTMDRFSALARKTKTILRRMELSDKEMLHYSAYARDGHDSRDDISVKWEQTSSSVQVSWHRLGSGTVLPFSDNTYLPCELRMQMLLHSVLSYRLVVVVREYYTTQKIYNENVRKRIERQMSIIGREMDRQEIDKAIEVGESVSLLHGDIVDDTQVSKEMRAKLREIQFFEHEILALEKSISQLHEAFLMVSSLVHEQGAMVDRIEHHVGLASNYVEVSNQMLKKAGKLQHKYRKKKLCLALLILTAIGIIVLVIALSVKRKRTTVRVVTHSVAHPRLRRDEDWFSLTELF